ncbi:MAG: PAS domain-containing sensor histidine kinase [Pseudomonadota bacterium]
MPLMQTHFLPPERADAGEVARLRAVLQAEPLLQTILDGIPDGTMILNAQRQVIMANLALLQRLGLADDAGVAGKRPGEAFGCIHAKLERHGCGTTRFCRYCGAARVLAECHMTRRAAEECRIVSELESETDAIDLLVWGTPLTVAGEGVTLFAVADLTHAKRRQVLERIFLHDFANSLNALAGYVDLMAASDLSAGDREMIQRIDDLVDLLATEIASQRQLVQAESGNLTVTVMPFHTLDLLSEVKDLNGKLEAAQGKALVIDPASAALTLVSDVPLLLRVMMNLVKNALEATAAGGAVTLGCAATPDGAAFWVHNPVWLDQEVQLQAFKRSYSTKGPGRGIGLYSARLLSERYLKGRISFQSTEQGGTVFRVELPRKHPQAG